MNPPTRHDGPWIQDGDRGDLRERSVRSGALQLGAQAAKLALLMASGMILARLLTPRDFGLLAMVTAVTGLAEHIRLFGLPEALVHGDRVSWSQARALFRHGMRLTLAVAAAMLLAAPVLAWIYGESRVVAIMAAFAAIFAVRGLVIIHEGVLMRGLRFGALAFADVTSMALGMATGIGAAAAGWGYWSLVVQAAVLALIRTVLVGWRAGWRLGGGSPSPAPADVRSHTGYGSDVTRYRVLEYAARNVDRVLVGAVEGSRSLGFYDAAYRWSLYPLDQVAGPLSGVVLASLSRVRHDGPAYRRAFRTGLLPFFTVVMGGLVFFAVEGQRVILLLLGDQWDPAVVLFRVLCVSGVAASLIRVSRWLFLVHGTTARQVRWGLVYLPVMVVTTAAGLPWGALGVACGYTVGTWLMMPSAVSSSLRDSALEVGDVMAVAVRPAVSAAAAAGPTLWMAQAWPGPVAGVEGALVLLRQGVTFGAIFALVWLALPGGLARASDGWGLLSTVLRRDRPGSRGP